MIDPGSLGAGAIAKLAFDAWVKADAGEVAKATVAGAVDLIKGLRDRIRAQFAGNARAIAKVTKYFNTENFQIATSPDASSKTLSIYLLSCNGLHGNYPCK